jgi:predicted esterase
MTDTDASQMAEYRSVLDAVMPLYLDGRYDDALRLVRASSGSRSHHADTAHLAACLLSLGGDPAGAVAELQAALDAGQWWDRQVLEDDDDLAAAAEVSGWAQLVDASAQRCAAAQGDPVPAPVVLRPQGKPTLLLVALHGAGSDGADTAPRWGAAVDDGALLVAPYSSHRTTPTRRSWPDLMVGGHDVERALADVQLPGDVPIVLGGASAGARQAMLMTLTANPLAPQRFLVVGPALDRIELDPGTVRRAGERGVRGHVVLGADDEGYAAVTAKVAQLSDAGVATTLDVVEGLGHDYPDDFPERLRAELPRLVSGV